MKKLIWVFLGAAIAPIAPALALVVIKSAEADPLILSVAWCAFIQGTMLFLMCMHKATEGEL